MKSYKVFILDVDGVMTDGKFYYSEEGKIMKIFGPDDNDALGLLGKYIDIRFVTGDRKGLEISKKRIEIDMKYKLDLVSTIHRVEWIKKIYDLKEVIYMGDGIFDHFVMKEVGYSVSPNNAHVIAKEHSDYITKHNGGDRAVAEASFHIMEKFFDPYDKNKLPEKGMKVSGEWKV